MENILARLKKYEIISLVVAVCYFAGYFSYAYHYRLLGLSNISATPLEYLTYGGDFFISSIINVFKVPIDNLSLFFRNLFLGDFKYPSALLFIILILRLFKARWLKWHVEKITNFLMVLMLLGFNLLLITWQSSNLLIDNVLTVHPQSMYLEFNGRNDLTNCELLEEMYQQNLETLKNQSPGVYARIDKWFNMKSIDDLSKNRLVSYSGLCLVFVLSIVIWLTIFIEFRGQRIWSVVFIALFMVNFIFLSISYGILGKSYQMPYSQIKFKSLKDSLQNRVYILKEEPERYIVYDKLNFFQIKYILKSDVKEVDQLFSLNPFHSPIKNQFALCDSLQIIPKDIDH